MIVSMEFSDGCKDADSVVEVYETSVPPFGKAIDQGVIPDMQTRAFTFEVPPGGLIMFNCRGTGNGNPSGGCSWHLVSAIPKQI
jgi:hypothetical protein